MYVLALSSFCYCLSNSSWNIALSSCAEWPGLGLESKQDQAFLALGSETARERQSCRQDWEVICITRIAWKKTMTIDFHIDARNTAGVPRPRHPRVFTFVLLGHCWSFHSTKIRKTILGPASFPTLYGKTVRMSKCAYV